MEIGTVAPRASGTLPRFMSSARTPLLAGNLEHQHQNGLSTTTEEEARLTLKVLQTVICNDEMIQYLKAVVQRRQGLSSSKKNKENAKCYWFEDEKWWNDGSHALLERGDMADPRSESCVHVVPEAKEEEQSDCNTKNVEIIMATMAQLLLGLDHPVGNLAHPKDKSYDYHDEEALFVFRNAFYKDGDNAAENIAATLHQCGVVSKEEQRYTEAMVFYQAALSLYRKVHGEDVNNNANIATTLYHLGLMLHELERYVEAHASYQDALAIYRRVYAGEDNVDIAVTLQSLGRVLFDMECYVEAQKYYQDALVMMKQQGVYGQGNEDAKKNQDMVASTLHNLRECQESVATIFGCGVGTIMISLYWFYILWCQAQTCRDHRKEFLLDLDDLVKYENQEEITTYLDQMQRCEITMPVLLIVPVMTVNISLLEIKALFNKTPTWWNNFNGVFIINCFYAVVGLWPPC